MKTKTTICIADDHAAARLALAMEVSQHLDLDLVGEADSPTGLYALLAGRAVPDVLVTDLSFHGAEHIDGLRLLRELRVAYPRLRIMVFSEYETPALIRGALLAGAVAYVSKRDLVGCVVSGLRATIRGDRYLGASVRAPFERAQRRMRQLARPTILSPREDEVLQHYIAGRAIRDIAVMLARNVKTISALRGAAMRKLWVKSDAELFEYLSFGGDDGRGVGAAPDPTSG